MCDDRRSWGWQSPGCSSPPRRPRSACDRAPGLARIVTSGRGRARDRLLPEERSRARHGGGRPPVTRWGPRCARAGRTRRAGAAPLALAVAYAERFAVRPVVPSAILDGTLRGDFVAFLLASAPRGVRASSRKRPRAHRRARVRLWGPPPAVGATNRMRSAGGCRHGGADRDRPRSHALASKGWGGAPVLLADTDRVIGLVEAAVPAGNGTRVLAAPIGGVLDALRAPLDGGEGPRSRPSLPAQRRGGVPRPSRA